METLLAAVTLERSVALEGPPRESWGLWGNNVVRGQTAPTVLHINAGAEAGCHGDHDAASLAAIGDVGEVGEYAGKWMERIWADSQWLIEEAVVRSLDILHRLPVASRDPAHQVKVQVSILVTDATGGELWHARRMVTLTPAGRDRVCVVTWTNDGDKTTETHPDMRPWAAVTTQALDLSNFVLSSTGVVRNVTQNHVDALFSRELPWE